MKAIPAKTKPIKHSNLFIFLGILAGLLLIGGVITYKYVVDYYIPMQQLDQASKDLRPIYDKLLAENKGNIVSSYYRNNCSESSVKYGRGNISCGPDGRVVLNDQDSESKNVIEDSLDSIMNSLSDYTLVKNKDYDNGSINYTIKTSSTLRCYLGYGKND